MKYTDTLISQYDDAAFQTAFRAYFGELGCRVTNWTVSLPEWARRGAIPPGRAGTNPAMW